MSYQIVKNLPIEDKLNVIIRRLIESGLMDLYARESLFLFELVIAVKENADKKQSNLRYITMDHMGIMFGIFVFAMLGTIVIFAMEMIYFYKIKIHMWNMRLLRARRLNQSLIIFNMINV